MKEEKKMKSHIQTYRLQTALYGHEGEGPDQGVGQDKYAYAKTGQ